VLIVYMTRPEGCELVQCAHSSHRGIPEEMVLAKIMEVADEAREMRNSRARLANNPFFGSNSVRARVAESLTAVASIV
jgi:hypothetical protein